MKVAFTVNEDNIKLLKTKCDQVVYVDRRLQRPHDFWDFAMTNLNNTISIYSVEDIGLQLFQFVPVLEQLRKHNKVIHFLEKGPAAALSNESYNELLLDLGKNDKKWVGINKYAGTGKIGRPRINQNVIDEIERLHSNEKRTIREIALTCNVSIGTAHKYVMKLKHEENSNS